MPFTGGFSPQPERTGGGEASEAAPLLQRIFESIATARGPAFDQGLSSAVGAENMALARALTFDLFGANVRFTNEANPAYATVAGLLPRWETILGVPPVPGDSQTSRQARCVAALQRFGRLNTSQTAIDLLTNLLGKLFVGLTLFGPNNASAWYPWFGGAKAFVASVSGNLVTVSGLSTDTLGVPTSGAGTNLVLTRANAVGNDGTFLVHSWVSADSVICVNNGSPSAPDYGLGGSIGNPKISWTMPNPNSPFTSTTAHVDVLVNPTVAPGYVNPDGTPNGVFFSLVAGVGSILDLLLPADCTFDWYLNSSHGGPGFYLDEPNLDLEIFGT